MPGTRPRGGSVSDERALRYRVMALEEEVRAFTWQARELRSAARAPSSGSALEMERRVFRRVRDLAFALERRAAGPEDTPSPRPRARPRAGGLAAPICPRYAHRGPGPGWAREALGSAATRPRLRVRDPHDPPDDPLGHRRRLGQLLWLIEAELPELIAHVDECWRARRKAGTRFFRLQLRLRQLVRGVLFLLERLYEPRIDLGDLHFRLGGDEGV